MARSEAGGHHCLGQGCRIASTMFLHGNTSTPSIQLRPVGKASTLTPIGMGFRTLVSQRNEGTWWVVYQLHAQPLPWAIAVFPEIWATTAVLPSASYFLPWGTIHPGCEVAYV